MAVAAFDPLELLTIREAGQLLKFSRTSVYREIDEGRLHVVKIRGSIRITRAELERYIRAAAEVEE